MLVATSQRVIVAERGTHFIKSHDIAYDFIDGVNYTPSAHFAKLTLYTRTGNYYVTQTDSECAARFSDYIKLRYTDHHHHLKEMHYDNIA
jgi:hypothetical protein